MGHGPKNILLLPELVADLPSAERERFSRIFHISRTTGLLDPPPSMYSWIARYFGSLNAVREQALLKITNLITLEGALFNPLRANRPMEARSPGDLEEIIEKSRGCAFCRPLEETPADTFGRIQSKYSLTASNIAKYDGFHSLVIFREHNPLLFTREQISDYLNTGLTWAQRAHQEDPEAKYFFFLWNCLWRAGASVIHGHAQVALAKDMPYPVVETLRKASEEYRLKYFSNYSDDLFRVHLALQLAWQVNHVRSLVYLAPIKENEVLILSPQLGKDFADAIFTTLDGYLHQLGAVSFNLSVTMPPLAPDERNWDDFPVIARLVDRGEPLNRTSDIGGMELYAASTISSDPFAVARALRPSSM